MSNPVFTIQNTTSGDVYFHVYHLGAGRIPWINGLPRVHTILVPANSMRNYSPDDWIMDFDIILSAFIDVVIVAGEIVLAVATEGGAVGEELEIDESLWVDNPLYEALGSEAQQAVIDDSGDFIDQVASKLNLTRDQIRNLAIGAGMAGLGVVTSTALDKLLPGFSFYLSNKSNTVFSPTQAIFDMDKNDGSTLFIVSSKQVEIDFPFGGPQVEVTAFSDAWSNVTDDITVSGGAGIWLNYLPGFSDTSPEADS